MILLRVLTEVVHSFLQLIFPNGIQVLCGAWARETNLIYTGSMDQTMIAWAWQDHPVPARHTHTRAHLASSSTSSTPDSQQSTAIAETRTSEVSDGQQSKSSEPITHVRLCCVSSNRDASAREM